LPRQTARFALERLGVVLRALRQPARLASRAEAEYRLIYIKLPGARRRYLLAKST